MYIKIVFKNYKKCFFFQLLNELLGLFITTVVHKNSLIKQINCKKNTKTSTALLNSPNCRF